MGGVNAPCGRVRDALEAALGRVQDIRAVAGGSICSAWRLCTARGEYFVKHLEHAPPGFFAAEAEGLAALRGRSALRVPLVVAQDEEAGAFLALQWLEPGPADAHHWRQLGSGLAELHAARESGWGWVRDGFIGSLPQPNGGEDSWAGFWERQRLRPMLARAGALGRRLGPTAEWERLFSRLPRLLAAAEEEGPSLVHGDLWQGNALATAGGPAVVDPALYRGHREVDLAMAELFGGFGAEFFAAYQGALPLLPGYHACRRYVYQLYYLLVHVMLFGDGYSAQTLATLHRALNG